MHSHHHHRRDVEHAGSEWKRYDDTDLSLLLSEEDQKKSSEKKKRQAQSESEDELKKEAHEAQYYRHVKAPHKSSYSSKPVKKVQEEAEGQTGEDPTSKKMSYDEFRLLKHKKKA